MKTIDFNPQVEKLEMLAFHDVGVEEISFPTTVKTLKNDLCRGCRYLKKITIPSSLTSIEQSVFSNCSSLVEFNFDEHCQLKVLEQCLFFYCPSLQSITLPSSVTRIAENVFDDCASLTYIDLSNVQVMGNCSFKNCTTLEHITIPSTVTQMDSFVFEKCFYLKEICLPDTVLSIGDQLFLECQSLTSVTLSTSLTYVDKLTFNKCSSLKEIWIGNKKIREYPFEVTYSIAKQFESIGITCKEIVLTITDLHLLQDPKQKKDILIIPPCVTKLDDNCFRNNNQFKEIYIHKQVKTIGKDCFKNCKAAVVNKAASKWFSFF